MSLVVDLIGGLVKLGVNLTDGQTKTLKWRLSKAGRKHYSDKENNEFYVALQEGNTDIIDVTRKEKQIRINELKRKLGKK